MSRAQSSFPLKSNAFNTPTPVMTHTVSPLVTGDGDDMFCFRSMWLPPAMGPFHSVLPVFRSRAHSSRFPEPSAVPMFRKIVSFQMIGVDPLRPGIANFQVMFSSGDHFIGRPVSVLVPFIAGPRQWGQLSADKVTTAAMARERDVINSRFIRTDPPRVMVLQRSGGIPTGDQEIRSFTFRSTPDLLISCL